MCRTTIGFGAPKKQGTAKAHGEPLGDEELNAAKDNLGWPKEPRFFIPDDVLEFYCKAVDRGRELEYDWKMRFDAYSGYIPSRCELTPFEWRIAKLESALPTL
jgi:transketolase